MKNRYLVFAGLVVLAVGGMTFAQRGGFGGRGGGLGGPGGPGGFGGPPNPLSQAIDADGDGEITMAELSKAKEIFAKLDANKDGKIAEDELRPRFVVGRGEGPGGFGPPDRGSRRRGGGERGGRERGGAEGGVDATAVVARYMSLDKDKDGKVTQDEAGPRLEGLIARADANKDGAVTKEEFTKLATSEGSGRGGRGRGGREGDRGGREGDRGGREGDRGGREGDRGGREGDRGGREGDRGGREGDRGGREGDRSGREGGRGGREGGRGGFGGPGGPAGFGPPSPEQFVARAMEFDANKDGQLSKEELGKMASEMVNRGPRGFGDRDHDHAEGGGRRGPRDRDGGNSNRPQRPSRPE